MPEGSKSPLDTTELLRRLHLMQSTLSADVWRVLRLRSAVLPAKLIMDTPRFRKWDARAETANVVASSTLSCFAYALSHLFESSSSSEMTDEPVASIPNLSSILGNEQVRSALIDRSRGWISPTTDLSDESEAPEGSRSHSIDFALATGHQVWIEPYSGTLAMLRAFCERHHFDIRESGSPTLPEFKELCRLADLAQTFVLHSSSAIEGRARDLAELDDAKRGPDGDFWRAALAPLTEPEP